MLMLDITDVLAEMEDRMFTEELFGIILSEYKKEPDGSHYADTERGYENGRAELDGLLNSAQREQLSRMEVLCAQNAHFALRFGFTRGLYAGFQQFFVDDSPKSPFDQYVVTDLLQLPGMKTYPDYYHTRSEFNDLFDALDGQLPPAAQEHLLSIYSAWEERLYAVLRYAFYLGYRYALSGIRQVHLSGIPTEKVLLTENELGFTYPQEFREIQRRAEQRRRARPQEA